jgi:SPP1 family predicted phage head-tail adaptor
MTMIGELRHKITVYVINQREEVGGSGTIPILTEVARLYAKIEDQSGMVKFDTKQIGQEITHKITIRYWPLISSQHWIKLGNRNFEVINVRNFNERSQYLEIMAREVFDDDDSIRASEGRANDPVEE